MCLHLCEHASSMAWGLSSLLMPLVSNTSSYMMNCICNICIILCLKGGCHNGNRRLFSLSSHSMTRLKMGFMDSPQMLSGCGMFIIILSSAIRMTSGSILQCLQAMYVQLIIVSRYVKFKNTYTKGAHIINCYSLQSALQRSMVSRSLLLC